MTNYIIFYRVADKSGGHIETRIIKSRLSVAKLRTKLIDLLWSQYSSLANFENIFVLDEYLKNCSTIKETSTARELVALPGLGGN